MLLKNLDTRLMVAFLQGALREVAAVLGREPRARRAEVFEQVTTLCWDSIKL